MSDVPPAADYESLCARSLALPPFGLITYLPAVLSGGGPARGRLSLPSSWRSPSLSNSPASGTSQSLGCRSGRCAASTPALWRSVVLLRLFSGASAITEGNPWSESWAVVSHACRLQLCGPLILTSGLQDEWAHSLEASLDDYPRQPTPVSPPPRLSSWLPSLDDGGISRGNGNDVNAERRRHRWRWFLGLPRALEMQQ